MSPLPADFALVPIPGAPGRLIWFGQALNGDGFQDYQHACMLLPDGMVLEAEPGGARIVPVSEYDGFNIAWSSWSLTDEQRINVVAAGRALEHTPYSFLDYASLGARRLHIPAPGLRSYIASTGHMICSQLVDEASRGGGVQLFDDGRWPGDVTPLDLWKVRTGPKVA